MVTTLNGIKVNGDIKSIIGVKINGTPVSNWKGIKFYRGSTLVGQYDFSPAVIEYIKYQIEKGTEIINLPSQTENLTPLVYASEASQDWVNLPEDQSEVPSTYGQNIWRGTSGLFRALLAQSGDGGALAPSDLQVYCEGANPFYSIKVDEEYLEGNIFRWQRHQSLSNSDPRLIGQRNQYVGGQSGVDDGLNPFLTNALGEFDTQYQDSNNLKAKFVLIPSWVYHEWTLDENNSLQVNDIDYINTTMNGKNYPLILFDESGRASGATNINNVAVISYSRYNLAYAAGVAAAQAAHQLKADNFTNGEEPIIDIVIGDDEKGDRIDLVNAIIEGIKQQIQDGSLSITPIVNILDLKQYTSVLGSPLDLWTSIQQTVDDSGFNISDKIIVTNWPEFFQYWKDGDWEETSNVYGIYFGNSPIVHRYNYWKAPVVDGQENTSINSIIQGPVSRDSGYAGRPSNQTINSLIYEVYPNYNFNLTTVDSDIANLGSRALGSVLGVPSDSSGNDLTSEHPLSGFDLTEVDGGYEGPVLAGGAADYTEGDGITINVIACDSEGNYGNNNIFTYLSNRATISQNST